MENKKILITGGFGFIGSNLIKFLNQKGIIPHVSDTGANKTNQWKNVVGLKFNFHVNPGMSAFDVVVHLGANVDTTEPMNEILWQNNFEYSKKIRRECSEKTKFIYASSASVYGAEEKDFSERVVGLKPLNAYGFSKWMLDNYFFVSNDTPLFCSNPKTIGLRFFNVYGPNESHKGNMASVIHKALNKKSPFYGKIRDRQQAGYDYGWNLFKSHREEIKDGEQKRDFVYVKDVCEVIWHFITYHCESGIYNLGSGQARSFNDLVKAVDPKLETHYIDMPDNIKPHYQYFTQADLTKLRKAGYTNAFTSLEDGIAEMKKELGL